MLYVRELVRDYHKLDTITKCDIDFALLRLYRKGLITRDHVQSLVDYIGGSYAREIDSSKLRDVLYKLEQETHYLDEYILEAFIQRFPQYTKIRPSLLKEMLRVGDDLTKELEEV